MANFRAVLKGNTQLLHRLTIAMAAAMWPSVTVSMGELTTGMLKRSLRVSWVANATCRGAACSRATQSGSNPLKKQNSALDDGRSPHEHQS